MLDTNNVITIRVHVVVTLLVADGMLFGVDIDARMIMRIRIRW